MLSLIVALGIAVGAPTDTGRVNVAVRPDTVLIERGEGRRFVNADFELTNATGDSVELVEIMLSVRDARGRLVMQKLVNENGMVPSIETVPGRRMAPGASTYLFNPMHDFPGALPLDTLAFDFTFRALGRDGRYRASARVAPREYRPRTTLELPLRGRLLAYDNHDFYAHHRRLNLSHPAMRMLGITGNSGRYAFDLSIVDEQGRMYRGDGSRNEDWYSWEQPVHATGDGVVVASANDREDYRIGGRGFEAPKPPFDPMIFSGNYVVIDHGNGEYSLLAHMRKGSVRVHSGDRVRRGQVVGLVGFSGSVITIHTHYQLQRGPTFGVEGLPAYFSGFERVRGDASVRVPLGMVDTGEIVRQLTTGTKP